MLPTVMCREVRTVRKGRGEGGWYGGGVVGEFKKINIR